MPYTRIILDTNTYLRLGNSIKPLFGIPFGDKQYALYLHKEIQHELNRSSRIKTKFYWIEQEENIKERKKVITCSNKDKAEIEKAYDFIWAHQKDVGYDLAREDIFCIAYAYVLQITLVTDEINMIKAAKDYEIDVMNTLELMNLMLEADFIAFDKITEITEYWKYNDDLPGNFLKDFKRLFKNKNKEI